MKYEDYCPSCMWYGKDMCDECKYGPDGPTGFYPTGYEELIRRERLDEDK